MADAIMYSARDQFPIPVGVVSMIPCVCMWQCVHACYEYLMNIKNFSA